MPRSFSKETAERLYNTRSKLLHSLETAQEELARDEQEIKKASDAIITQNVLQILKEVSVDELSRERSGIRIKTLQESGYNTMADIATATVHQLASIRGISQDAAYTIHRISSNYVAQAWSNTKLRISADNRTEAHTRLIKAIAAYQEHKKLAEFQSENTEYLRLIHNALRDLDNGICSNLKWFFTPGYKKKKAERAYTYFNKPATSKIFEWAAQRQNDIDLAKQCTTSQAWERFSKNPISYINVLEAVVPQVLGTDHSEYGLPEDLAREIQDQCFFPDGLLCELRRYQELGVKYALHQEKVLLGDEMGLGKTVQAIATLVSLKNTGATHFLVICPASVITNWCREIVEKSKLRVTKIHGAGRNAALKDWVSAGGVGVTTYETTGYFHLDDSFRFSQLVVDEAHYIKNPDAQRTKGVKAIARHAERLLFMTGTALENKVEEMITLIQMLQPRIAAQVQGMAFMAAAPQFRMKVAPVYYRRKREDVLTELPEKIESKEWCTLSPMEEDIYERAVLSKSYSDARRVSWNIDDLNYSSKAKRLKELVEEAESDGRKIIIFSFFLDTISKVTMLLGDKCMNPINGSVSPQRRQEIIDEFDQAPAGAVLPAQIQSGGTGLNIQSASVVILCEPQFKPSIENQAISRAYRMGQARNVLVYRLLCENTIDEKITKMLEDKQKLFDAFADKSVAAEENLKLEIDEKTFGNIIKEEIDRINAKHMKN